MFLYWRFVKVGVVIGDLIGGWFVFGVFVCFYGEGRSRERVEFARIVGGV